MSDRDRDDEQEWYSPDGGMLIGREAALADWSFKKDNKQFEKLVAVLRAKKWAKEHPERRREIALAYSRKPGVKDKQLANARRRRKGRAPAKLVCLECRAEFQHRRKTVEFCRDACRQRFRYQQRTPGARRIARRAA